MRIYFILVVVDIIAEIIVFDEMFFIKIVPVPVCASYYP